MHCSGRSDAAFRRGHLLLLGRAARTVREKRDRGLHLWDDVWSGAIRFPLPTMNAEATAPTTPAPSLTPPAAAGRVVCIDALRGFDMFWIMGGKPLLVALA